MDQNSGGQCSNPHISMKTHWGKRLFPVYAHPYILMLRGIVDLEGIARVTEHSSTACRKSIAKAGQASAYPVKGNPLSPEYVWSTVKELLLS